MTAAHSTGARPHVLYVTPIFGYPAYGGPRLRTYTTLRALARRADVTLVVTQQPDTPDREAARAHLRTFCRDVIFPAAAPEPTGLTPTLRRLARRVLPGPVRSSLAARLRGLRRASATRAPTPDTSADGNREDRVAALQPIVERVRPDVVWLGFGGISYDLIPLKHVAHAPLVLETECVWSRFLLREAPYASDPSRRDEILAEGHAKEAEERAGALEVDLTTAVSGIDADYFRELAPSPDRVLPLANVIDVDAYADDPASPARVQEPAVVFAGTFSHGTANVDAAAWLIDEVMPIVWQRRPDVHLYLVGRHPAPELVARRGPRVHLTGEVPSVVPYMRAARAALVPLRWESGTRFKILEAFACRTPVVSTTLGAEGLAVEHGRHLLLADTASDFAEAVLFVVDDPTRGASLVEPAYALVRADYDLSSAERQIGVILERLASREVARR